MFHSTWDLEVYARDLQDRRRAEAAAARRTYGLSRGRQNGDRLGLALTRFVAKIRLAISPPAASRVETAPRAPAARAELNLAISHSANWNSASQLPNWPDELYSAMLVIARGPAAKPLEESRAARDC
jgi:hypothetical protein